MAADDSLGCFGALVGLAVVSWVPLHFSGKSILFNRSQVKTELTYMGSPAGTSYLVSCHYFNSTGTEEVVKQTGYPDNYYCPRLKDIGND
jgi:hypothetical protein